MGIQPKLDAAEFATCQVPRPIFSQFGEIFKIGRMQHIWPFGL
jgi:hypothetical protein